MEVLKSARSLVDYINMLDNFSILDSKNYGSYEHIGGLYTNIILQSGLSYKNVVEPRVFRIINEFPETYCVEGLIFCIEKYGIEDILNWKHHQKLDRFLSLIEFSICNNINTCFELREFLKVEENRKALLSIKGLGYKTLDYTLKLLNFDTIAVDRHIISFVESAGINHYNYNYTKRTVEYAADLLNISRSSLDATIWKYMSTKKEVKNEYGNQLSLSF